MDKAWTPPSAVRGGPAVTRVLVVEDDPAVQSFVRRVLEQLGHAVFLVDTVAAAQHRLESERYDVVLLDLQLPGQHGHSLLRQLQQTSLAASPSVIVMTGTGTLDDAIEALRRRAADYIRKPFYAEHLTAAMDRVLSLRWAELRAVSPAETKWVSERANASDGDPLDGLPLPQYRALSVREREVLREFSRGRRVPEIARALHISPHTVRNHLKAMFRKFGVHSQAELLEHILMNIEGGGAQRR